MTEAWGGDGISYWRGGAVMGPEDVGGNEGYVIGPAEADPLSGAGTKGGGF